MHNAHELRKIAGKGLNQNTHDFAHAVSLFCILHIFYFASGSKHRQSMKSRLFPSFYILFKLILNILDTPLRLKRKMPMKPFFLLKTPPFSWQLFSFSFTFVSLFVCFVLFLFVCLPCSCFLRFLRLQILTVQTDTIIATMKKSTPPEKNQKNYISIFKIFATIKRHNISIM